MGRRKSAYAEKHSVYTSRESELSSQFFEKNQDLFEAMRTPHNFYEKFLELPYLRQIAMIEMFRDIIREKISFLSQPVQEKLLDLASEELETIHWATGSYYEEGNSYYPISTDEKKLVRMECYGTIDVRREHELSPYYKFFSKPDKRGKFRLKDYDLNTSPMWRVFNQFESFRSIAPSVRRYLYKKGINPDALTVMTVNDFCDIIHKIYANPPSAMKARFLPSGYKNKFVMNFMRHCGKDLEHNLLERGIDERKVKSLCRMMAMYGICDVDRVVITETHYTQRILDDLKKNNYDVSEAKVGEPISEKVYNDIFANFQESLLMARDENGIPLSKDDLPRFEVHHKNAVKFAHSDDYLAKVNYNSNLMLVEKEIHRAYFHGFDSFDTDVQTHSRNERYFSRINNSSSLLCLMDGFKIGRDMIFYDLENNVSAQNRARHDKENIVNYYEMQFERLNNIPVISKKYGIEYSKTDLDNEYKNLMEIRQVKITVPKEEIEAFEKIFAPQKKSKQKVKNNSVITLDKTGNGR